MKKKLFFSIGCLFLLTACTTVPEAEKVNVVVTKMVEEMPTEMPSVDIPPADQDMAPAVEESVEIISEDVTSGFDISMVPEYRGRPFAVVNNNTPYPMDEWEISTEYYSPLDELGRCGVAYACIGEETMPGYGEERGDIGMVKPSGWQIKKYPELIEDNFLYNRCHLIAWCLGAENDNVSNLITGTRYMNVEGMLPWEEKVADYVYATKNHVLYRATPVFEGDEELLCRGILIEAKSVEDDLISFCVWCYNVQPGIMIDYATGDSYAEGSLETVQTYVLNTKTHKVHRPECDSVSAISDSNRHDYTGKAEVLIPDGYEPCKACNPW